MIARMKHTLPTYLYSFFIIIAVTAALFIPTKTHAQIPFGGPITFLYPACFEGSWIILGPPTPGSYMSSYATRSFSHGRASHVGQYLLGNAGGYLTCTVQCGLVPCVIGGGLLILYHGSSL